MSPNIPAAQVEIAEAMKHLVNAERLLGGSNPTPDVITDRDPRPIPALPAIEPGQVIVDPTFGSRIARVTGPQTGASEVLSYRSSDSPMQRAWNATVSRVTVEDTYGSQHVFSFEPDTLRTRYLRRIPFDRRRDSPVPPASTVVPFNGSDCAWHDTNPDRLYGRSGNTTIKVFDFLTEQMTTVVELADVVDLPEDTYTSGVCVMNDTLLTVCGGAVNDDNHIVVAGPLSRTDWWTLDTLTLTQFNHGKGFLLHSTVLDLTARYVLMCPSQKSGVEGGHLFVWDLQTGAVTEVTVAVSGHFAVGRGMWVNQDCAPGTPWDAAQWTSRTFSSPNKFVLNCIDPILQPTEIYLAEHPSWTNMVNAETPFVSATYRHQVSDVPWRAWDEEIITVNPSSGEVKRYAHHRSQVLKDGVWDYWATPRANVSPDGKFALFTSNWGRSLGTDSAEGGDRQDAFVVELR